LLVGDRFYQHNQKVAGVGDKTEETPHLTEVSMPVIAKMGSGKGMKITEDKVYH
jgi:hypothetical protein